MPTCMRSQNLGFESRHPAIIVKAASAAAAASPAASTAASASAAVATAEQVKK